VDRRGEKRESEAKAGWGVVLRGADARGSARSDFGRWFRDGLDESQRKIGDFLMRAVALCNDGEVKAESRQD